MFTRMKKFSLRNKGMESLQAVLLLGAAFLIIWGLMSLYQDNEKKFQTHIGTIADGTNKPTGGNP